MKKYLISTLTAAAAMAVPAFADGELIASWDFTSMSETSAGSTTIYATGGDTSLYITTSSADYINSSGSLYIKPAADDKTTVNISSYGITTEEGISVVMTITGWSTESNGGIFASIETDNTSDGDYAAAIGENGSGSTSRDSFFAADGQAANVTSEQYDTISVDWNTGITVAMTFIGDTLSLYELKDGDYVLIAVGTINGDSYDKIAGNIEEVALGSWDSSLNGSAVNNMTISSLEIYKGDIMAVPEPSMFGLMFGLGAIGLVATRRRRRA